MFSFRIDILQSIKLYNIKWLKFVAKNKIIPVDFVYSINFEESLIFLKKSAIIKKLALLAYIVHEGH